MKARRTAAPLDVANAHFIEGGVSVIVATRDAGLVPEAIRACGCRVSRDRRRVTVLVDRTRADAVVADLAANGRIAVVFSQPSTHRTIQLKGDDASVVSPKPSDRTLVAAHRDQWLQELCSIGYARGFAEALWGRLPAALLAIAFSPSAAFQQTPGPGAGQPIERPP